MGYSCPVCDTPQRDGEHLANHLAFTAMLHGGDHEAWLDDRVPEWASRGAAELAPAVTEFADDAEYDEVFEDTVDRHDHGSGSLFDDSNHDHGREPPVSDAGVDGDASDPETRRVIEEARELTRRMLDDDEKA
ncbi:DUF5810 domain-containing protein [Salinirarus marinus]|uniref:DUF5810 domain-containing protein n=1 Tax=Salinirarus marinus TaxID=3068310 RepID=UPI003C6C933E